MQLKLDTNYSVLELNNTVKDILTGEFPVEIWVHGEIQDHDRSKYKKHVFFKLCEKHSENDQIVAQVDAVIFEYSKDKIQKILNNSENPFELKDGIEARLLCKVDFFPRSGRFQLIVQGIDPVYTVGKLAQNRQKIINELKARGLLEKNKQVPFPDIPLCIGLITAYNSAAYHDFLTELKTSKFGFSIYYFNSAMQGENVSRDVCRGLKILEQISEIDVIAIIRGGGSTADLSWFDDQDVAEKIANTKKPVITGLGHEIDVSISDMVAHTYLKTPTAAAQFLTGKIGDVIERVNQAGESIFRYAQAIIDRGKLKLEHYATLLDSDTHKYLAEHRENVSNLTARIQFAYASLLKEQKDNLADIKERFPLIIDSYIKDFNVRLKHFTEKISILDPMNTVKRGFSITRYNGRVVKNRNEVTSGNILNTLVSDGEIISKVVKGNGSDTVIQ